MGDNSPQSKRDKLLELAKRKREEQEEQAAREAEPQTAIPDIDFGDSDEEDGAPATAEKASAPVSMADLFGDDEDEDEGPSAPTEEDRAFIDDTGVRPDDRIDFGDDEEQQFDKELEAEEADADDDLDKLFNKRPRRESQGEYENKAIVDSFLAQMEVAVEEDMKDFEQGKPATHKLRMLGKVQQMLSTKKLHSEMLDGGLLGVLKAWIDPMPDGTLPNSTIRTAILKVLDDLPIDCSLEDRKAQLKRSGLGKTVMFLAKVSDETLANKRLARALIEKWSRPILVPKHSQATESLEEQQIMAARQLRLASTRTGEDPQLDTSGRPVALKPGDPGFRWHASVPEPASLDYVKRPEPKAYVPNTNRPQTREKAGEHKLSKKLKIMAKKNQFGRAANVSVEGRNVTLQH